MGGVGKRSRNREPPLSLRAAWHTMLQYRQAQSVRRKSGEAKREGGIHARVVVVKHFLVQLAFRTAQHRVVSTQKLEITSTCLSALVAGRRRSTRGSCFWRNLSQHLCCVLFCTWVEQRVVAEAVESLGGEKRPVIKTYPAVPAGLFLRLLSFFSPSALLAIVRCCSL